MRTTETRQAGLPVLHFTNEYQPKDYTIERWITRLLALLFLLPFVAQAQEAQPLPTTTLSQVKDAALLLETGNAGVYSIAPTIRTDITIKVTGPIVRTRVQQTFKNTTGRCVEGLYFYPLPEMSSVDELRMTIGSRVIAGEIKEKREAARVYQKARSEGRKAALVEQHRPNVFTTSVASLMPDEDAVIEIEYQEVARFESGEYRLRFPMVVAARYNPPQPERDGPWQVAALAAGLLTPPDRTMNRSEVSNVTLTVDLEPGFPVRDVRSTFHKISQQTLGHNQYQLALDQKEVPADRDFELTWAPSNGSSPQATVMTERIGDQTYGLILITPPDGTSVPVSRETIFIIDSSGSMEGPSMEQAREALLLALGDLRGGDLFNVIDFDSEARALFEESTPADPAAIKIAKEFVAELVADGGTEMLGAIRLALPSSVARPGTVRQVIFITDGQVGNEQELFRYIHENLGDSRLFTVGIGAAPNSHFMRNAARFGRGTFTYIGDLQQVSARMGELFAKLGSPVMTAIDISVGDPTAEMWPARIPDLYRGEPLMVAVRVTDPSAPIVIAGHSSGKPWKSELRLTDPRDESGIGKLWARQKIESLMDRLSEGINPAVVRNEVVPVALRHHLVTQYTSLVAVDQTASGLSFGACQSEMSPIENGGGAVPGVLPQTATPARLLLLAGLALVAIAAAAWKWGTL